MKTAWAALSFIAIVGSATTTAQAELTPYNSDVTVIEELPNEEASEPMSPQAQPQTQPQSSTTPTANNGKLVVVVDKGAQMIAISSPSTADMIDGTLYASVSTGGGLKIPNNPDNPKPPYCANTPDVERMVIRARPNKNMFEYYESGTFSDGEKRPIPMPYAIHIADGIFLHEVHPSKQRQLGQNVSGGCIRLPRKVAKFLYQELLTYGEMELTIGGNNPTPIHGVNECSQEALANAKQRYFDAQAQRGLPEQAQPAFPTINPFNNPVANFFKNIVEGI